MRLEGLLKPLKENEKFNRIVENMGLEKGPISIYDVSDSGKNYLIDAIFEKSGKSLVIITESDIEAKNIYEDLNLYTTNVYYFPAKETVFYNIDAVSGDLRWARLKVIKEILNSKKKIVVTSIDAFTTRYVEHKLFSKYSIKVKEGQEIDTKDFIENLVSSGYERTEAVDGKGQFSIRGGIIDIYPTCSLYPYRIEFFGDQVDSIRTFNTVSQRSIEKVKSADIFPAKEIIISDEDKKSGCQKLLDEFNELKKTCKDKERLDKLETIINKNIESLNETGSFENIDSYLTYFCDKTENLFDYLKNYKFILCNVKRCIGKIDSVYLEFNQNFESFMKRGDIFKGQGNLLVDKEEVLELMKEKTVISIESLLVKDDFLKPIFQESMKSITLNSCQGNVELLISSIKEKKDQGYKTVILSGTRPRGERLVNNLMEHEIQSSYKDDIQDINFGEVVITFGNQEKGFEFPEEKVCVISDIEIFGEAKRNTKKRRKKKKGIGKIGSFSELKPGDYVVHSSHGIGVYKGIKQIESAGHKRDYLDIVYAKGDKLYVPVEQLDLIQKYIGSEGKSPKVNKLGGAEWQKAKAKARKSINEIAQDLVKLYATRVTVKGHKFEKDTPWQKQFEDEFPYEETPDQITSLEEIKKDMESNKPMERLLCGDVGYGKTEVALRAAFKAVMDNKQVAFLVPTTILAEQHYKNIKSRFSDFPVKIDMISRFRTAKQQKETLKRLKEGNVDILIGTHRLVSKDIEFKDLGLLIVDEEQRFGVKQKEKIKNVKKNVDVLTLSATPIPRTLNMSLSGVRDISVIETPPEERYPIQTYVVEQNDQLIRDAILREIGRGGQIYFVYNRVENIEKMAAYVQKLVPEGKVGIAHGQMAERELESQMIQFMNNEYNILVCTTIIETGMDIKNVNTIIIYESDKMGLSQLYQLRGRVGRSNKIAYAYLLYTKDKVLSEVAEKRLKALKDFTELGSGFKIAMKDLEIRGAGNIMGSSQHGHMAAIGYDLYCRMLEDTVKLIKGEIKKEPVETTIDLKIDAFISENYIKDEIQKIEVYKRIAAIENQEDYDDIKDELNDRYSSIPDSVLNLMNIAYIKSLAKNVCIEEIKENKDEIRFIFQDDTCDYIKIYKYLINNYRKKVILEFGEKPCFIIKMSEIKKEEELEFLKKLLHDIVL
ncbi:transcription-repair coupling factor [Clostridium sp. BJN0001]|uniref:transcription-repair coupling factor n=1 Tax=Clostridium sp. BJN0001 TaxID=2930219 RepID=UPI001FD071C1|nr:transcription-repair coupling factor [Clostridium sp. BJN0001]